MAETGSFTRAAKNLRILRSSVSTSIQALEARLGTCLLQRTTRKVTLTGDGASFYACCVRLLAEFDAAEGQFRHSADPPSVTVCVDIPGPIARLALTPVLPEFFARFPSIRLELRSTDWPVDLVDEGIDAVVLIGAAPTGTFCERRVGDLPMATLASPSYLQARGAIGGLDDLAGHIAVGNVGHSNGRIADLTFEDDGKLTRVSLPAIITAHDPDTAMSCCLAGLGLIQAPVFSARPHLRCGKLVEILATHPPPRARLAILYPRHRRPSRGLAAFLDWAEAALAAILPKG